MNQKSSVELLERYVRARYPIIIISSHEESRVMAAVKAVAKNRKMQTYEWTYTRGLIGCPGTDPEMTKEPGALFETMLQYGSDQPAALFVAKDIHGFLGNKDRGFQPVLTRYLRDIAAWFEMSRHSLIITAPVFQVPPDLDKSVAMIDWPLPDESDLAEILRQGELDLDVDRYPVTLNGGRSDVIKAMRGLTAFEASSVLSSGIIATGELGEAVIPFIIKEKAQIIRKSGVLEYFDNSVTMQDVGGLQYLKSYAARKHAAFSADAKSHNVDDPRGCLLVGVPGTGKSLSAKAIAGAFRTPLLRMDIGALMGGLVGQSEANTRAALKTAEAVAPCVLWLDEIEKGLSSSGGEHDGGTSTRVFGTILTWMQETIAPVYFVATANDISKLRPELISRFDDVIFVDLPSVESRIEILNVHLAKRGQDVTRFDVNLVANALWGYSGREIERVVRSALETAFYLNGGELTTEHLLAAAKEMVPVSITMKDQVDAIRAWAGTSQARQAAEPLEAKPVPVASSKRMLDL